MLPIRVQLTAAVRQKGKGFVAECLEAKGAAGSGPTIRAARADLAKRLKQFFWTEPTACSA